MKPNAYFEELHRLGKEHADQLEAHKAMKPELDSTQLEAWYAEKKRLEEANPLTGGIGKAFRAWYWGKTDELELSDYLWDKEVQGFVETLRKAGIQSFVYTNQSTAVMENIHQLVAAGCALEGPCTLTRKEERWGGETEETTLGLRFRVN